MTDSDTPARASRWPRRGEPNRLEPECWPLLRPSFRLGREQPIFTIGSCFARNIENYLAGKGFDLPATRLAAARPDQSMNKYTPASIFQELSWTKAILDRDDTVHAADIERFLLPLPGGRVADAHRHSVERGGVTPDEALEIRQSRYAVFRQAFLCPVAVMTLGLIECWWDRETGDAVEMSPAVRAAGERFAFRRLTFAEAHDYAARALDLLGQGAMRHVLLTTSPVPLARTFTDEDVIVANTYSKSVLRAVCGQLADEREEVDYFPSYESVMLTRGSEVWLNDLTHVSPAFVSRIMARVVEVYAGEALDAVEDDRLAFKGLVADRQWAAARALHDRLQDAPAPDAKARARFHLDAAEMFLALGEGDAAGAQAEAIAAPRTSLAPDDLLRLARVLEGLGQRGRAGKIRAAGLVPPASPNVLRVRASTLNKALRTDDALLVVDAAVERFGGDLEGLLLIGDLYLGLGRPDRAAWAYEAAAALAPDDERPRQRLLRLRGQKVGQDG